MLMLAGIPVVILFAFNFNITLRFLLLTFFVNYLFMNFKVSVLFIPIVIISFLVTQHSLEKEDYTNRRSGQGVKSLGIFYIRNIP